MPEKKETTKSKKVRNPAVSGYIKRPYITEKASRLQGSGKYMFHVTKDANKVAIAQAVEQYYSVEVRSVNIINKKGKTKRRLGRVGHTRPVKKAIITLKKGQEITGLTA